MAPQTLLIVEAAGRPRHHFMGKVLSPVSDASAGIDQCGWANPLHTMRLNGATPKFNPQSVSASPASKACLLNCTNHIADPATTAYGGGEIYSFHTNGCIVAFADGHTDHLSAQIDPKVLVAMVTRNGDEGSEVHPLPE